jgi:3',5'-cyclic AMP phosphodiesterase CpdA
LSDGGTMPFDKSFLPPAQLELAVLGDTHFILDAEAYAIEFASVRTWAERAAHALRRAAALDADLAVHLGDLSEEPPRHADHRASRDLAMESLRAAGLDPVFVPGNMDIGDKPDPTMWTPPVSPASLDWFHHRFGPSWHSREVNGVHLVFLNSQILNGDLAAAGEQARWLEQDLAAHSQQRILLFLHMPPFFVAEDEPDTGFYNSIDEPARGWLTGLFRKHRVEAVFCGHTHFRAFNRVDDTRIHVCPSTTTSRAGFYEAFSVAPPPESGRNDPAKLGLHLVRVVDGGTRVHFVRTGGRTQDDPESNGWRELLTRTSADLPDSPLGLHLRSPLTLEAPGALAWPSVKRQRARDDHPFLHILEAGARHVRVPASDLADPLQAERLRLLRDEGVSVTGVWIAAPRLDLPAEVAGALCPADTVEVQLPKAALPDERLLEQLAAVGKTAPGGVSLAPLLPTAKAAGRYHPRARVGFVPDEVQALADVAATVGVHGVRAVVWLDPAQDPATAIATFDHVAQSEGIAGIDVPLMLPDDETPRLAVVAQAMLAAATRPGLRLYLDPFVDLDRTNDTTTGLLDRLGNPRPAFHAVRCLNTLLGSRALWHDDGPQRLQAGNGGHLALLPAGQAAPADGLACDLAAGRCRRVAAGEPCVHPTALITPPSG